MNPHITLNRSLEHVQPSRSVNLLAKVRQMQQSDPSVINLTGGEPDFDTPRAVSEEVYRQLLAGNTHYGDSRGDPLLREAIAHKLLADNQSPYSPDNILITPGGKYAVLLAMQALLNPGDEVLWLSPGWVSYPAIASLCHAVPVAVPLQRSDHYAISCDLLEAYTTDRTRLLVINYPNNPTGRILTPSDLQEIKRFLRRHPDICCLSDEIYEKIIYDGKQMLQLSADPEFFERTLVVNGFSKCSAMTGWRIGYLACNPEIYKAALKIFQHSISCVSGFIQKGALTALQHPEETERMRRAYENRKNILYEGLDQIPRIRFERPDGAFYAWIAFDTDMDSEELCARLLDQTGIGGIPGSAFGETFECAVRFCFASNEDILREFVRRLKQFDF